jgi:hypothetical protein
MVSSVEMERAKGTQERLRLTELCRVMHDFLRALSESSLIAF